MNTNTRRKNKFAGRRRNNQSSSRRKTGAALDPNNLIQKNGKNGEKKFIASRKFSDMSLDNRLKDNILLKGYEWPTEIQEASIEPLLNGRDLIGVASTGTGKTAAFLIPLIQRLATSADFATLIVVPTRELAIQVEAELRDLTRGMPYKSACFIGGTNVDKDVQKLRRFNQFIIGTPGRLLDMTDRGALRMKDISVLILDEFDRMLDMGFIQDIRRIVDAMGSREQTMLFSATMDPSQKDLVRKLTRDPLYVKISNGSDASSTVDQHLIYVKEDDNKFEVLVNMISEDSFEKVIIFAETKRLVDKLSKRLNRSGVLTSHIHGDKSQNYRNRAIKRFRNGASRVLVATDVAARGIDIEDVSHVINYQMPRSRDSYVHRIGRTGRAGKTGIAYTFVD